MDLLRESRYIISSFIIIIVCWLGWLCGLVFGQVGEAFTSTVNFPDVALTCLANLAVFFTCILLDKHSYETYAKDRMVIIRNEEVRNINGSKVMTTCGENLQKCSVVMLSFHYPATSGARKFMNSISNAFDVHSIFLRCRPLQCGAFTEDFRNCSCTENRDGRCGCIVFNTVEDITMMLARQLPGTLKRLPDSHCLIPSVCCLSKGCHGCNQGMLHVENDTLKEGDPNLESPAAVCEILESIPKVGACICIPVRPFLFCATIGLQLLYMVGCIAIGRVVGIKAFGRWIYGALRCLVLLKWVASNEILDNCRCAISQDSLEDGKPMWWYGTCGHYILSSAFLFNASLAGVRAQWKFS